ncbi:hypothetical protein FQR65_LT04287 [Abscondita terminalis]|nr:hypothetical protein FQR65_LT04287 [Abscondita terminalis]
MSHKRRDPGPIPKRWLHCPIKSSTLIVDKFLAFKTPLSSIYDDKVPLECRFSPSVILDYCKLQKIKLGLWIDLTNTNRFYDKEEIERANCKYMKLNLKGHGETPSKHNTNTFITVVQNFISKFPLEKIAVHCTHGFNRTGFLIVSYIVEKMDCDLEIALEMFATARPPGIYKKDYLEELYRRFDDVDDTPLPPQLPSWCFEDEDSQDSEQGSSQDSEPSRKRLKFDTGNKIPVFMEGVPGVTYFNEHPKASYLQRGIIKMCKHKGKGFPGAQPVSMDVNNISYLNQKPYRVSWKADGTRYLMLIHKEEEIYFFDRDNCVFKVAGLQFPHRKEHRHLRDTLVDGEMVIDKVNGTNIPRFLIYDIIKFDGQDVGQLAFFPIRLHCIENEIIKPRILAMENGQINKSKEPFSIRKKEFWPITQTRNLLGEKFARTLSHEPDGLIFQPAKEPYKSGSCKDVLKWKPLELNSVDFRLQIVKEEGMGIVSKKVGHLYVGQQDIPFAVMKFTKEIKDLHNKIIECKYEDHQWKFMRERTDKSFPNSRTTATAVCESIKSPVTKDMLLNYIDRNRFDDDSEMMPPPSSHTRR